MDNKKYPLSDGMFYIEDEGRKNRLEKFGELVALLPWFTDDVLHKLYVNIYVKNAGQPDAHAIKKRAITCGDLLQSPEVEAIGIDVYRIEANTRSLLRVRNKDGVVEQVGLFMLAYVQECGRLIPSPKYQELYLIEGQLITNKWRASIQIARHITNQLNRIKDASRRRDLVNFYLAYNDNKRGNFYQFLKTYGETLEAEAGIPSWKNLVLEAEGKEAVRVRLPEEVKQAIVAEVNIKAKPVLASNLVASSETFLFARDIDNKWKIIFEGKEIVPKVMSPMGMEAIRLLLEHPDQHLPPIQLSEMLYKNGFGYKKKPAVHNDPELDYINRRELEESLTNYRAMEHSIYNKTPQDQIQYLGYWKDALSALLSHYRSIKLKQEYTEVNSKLIKIEGIQGDENFDILNKKNKKESLYKGLMKSGDEKKRKDSIAKSINRAIDSIKEVTPELGNYLDEVLLTKTSDNHRAFIFLPEHTAKNNLKHIYWDTYLEEDE